MSALALFLLPSGLLNYGLILIILLFLSIVFSFAMAATILSFKHTFLGKVAAFILSVINLLMLLFGLFLIWFMINFSR